MIIYYFLQSLKHGQIIKAWLWKVVQSAVANVFQFSSFSLIKAYITWNINWVQYKIDKHHQLRLRTDLFRLSVMFSQYRSYGDTWEVWTFFVFIKKTASKNGNVKIWKKILFTVSNLDIFILVRSLFMNTTKVQTAQVSSYDLYWENITDKRKRSITRNFLGTPFLYFSVRVPVVYTSQLMRIQHS